MAVTGVRQPNERIIYNPNTDQPYFVRYSYAFEGLGNGTPLEPGEIIAQCRAAEDSATSTPLPAAGAPEFDLPQTRVDVRRYNQQTGQARVVVEWGVRAFSSGAGPDVFSERSEAISSRMDQPYMLALRSGVSSSTVNEIAVRQVIRHQLRTTIRKLKTDEPGLGDTISQNIAANIGKLMPWRGLDRIVVAGGFVPISQTQGYATLVLDFLTPVDAVGEGEIFTVGDYVNLPVAALTNNQVYFDPPNNATGTEAESLADTYGDPIPTFGWILS